MPDDTDEYQPSLMAPTEMTPPPLQGGLAGMLNLALPALMGAATARDPYGRRQPGLGLVKGIGEGIAQEKEVTDRGLKIQQQVQEQEYKKQLMGHVHAETERLQLEGKQLRDQVSNDAEFRKTLSPDLQPLFDAHKEAFKETWVKQKLTESSRDGLIQTIVAMDKGRNIFTAERLKHESHDELVKIQDALIKGLSPAEVEKERHDKAMEGILRSRIGASEAGAKGSTERELMRLYQQEKISHDKLMAQPIPPDNLPDLPADYEGWKKQFLKKHPEAGEPTPAKGESDVAVKLPDGWAMEIE